MLGVRDNMARVAFILNKYQIEWKGGLNYYRSLINAISDLPDSGITPVIITGLKTDKSAFIGFPDVEIIKSSVFERNYPCWFLQRSVDKIFKRDILIERLLKNNHIDLLSHANFPLNPHSLVPMCTWIPDFQITQMPEFFSEDEIAKMTHDFMILGQRSTKIIVSSFDAQKDLANFAPEFVGKSCVLQFVARPQFDAQCTDLKTLQQKYNFNDPYFLVPNQFWVHKNHKILVEALTIMKASKRDVLILATGKQYDHRHPNYNDELKNLVVENGLSKNFRALGEIPYSDLSGLMYNSISMINPSFFEGWSTSVEEAKSLGKHIILSDIPIHREQAPVDGSFFNPNNAEELAEVLWNRAVSYNLDEDQVRRTYAKDTFAERWKNFGRTYSNIVSDVLV
jgi:glycosyltransferase involved in cell wall biosynthesis